MKMIVAGSRNFDSYSIISEALSTVKRDYPQLQEIVHGCARGADSLAGKWCTDNGFPVKEFPADWKNHKKAAGPLRNEAMAQYGTHLLAFWDGSSKGTADMILRAHAHGLKVQVVIFKETEEGIQIQK
jgi:hypothetical protein